MRLVAQFNTKESLVTKKEGIMETLGKIPVFRTVDVPVHFTNWKNKKFIIDDKGNLIALVSKRYVLTQPRDILTKLIETIIDRVESLSIYHYEGKIFCKCMLESLYGDGNLKYRAGFIYVDSVDKSRRLKLIFAPKLLWCSNDLILTKHSLNEKHIKNIGENVNNFIREFNNWISDVSKIDEVKTKYKAIELKVDEAKQFIEELRIPKKYKQEVDYSIAVNVWDMYMQLTHILTKYKAPLQYHFEITKLLKI